jgi:hypothetical protein
MADTATALFHYGYIVISKKGGADEIRTALATQPI